MTEDGAEAAGESQTLFFVDRYLRNAVQLILDRVFNGDDLIFLVANFIESSIQSCCFSRTGGPGHQDHAVRFGNITPKLSQVFRVEPDDVQVEVFERFIDLLFVEDTNDGVFAVNRRHDGNTKVYVTSFVTHAEAPILRHAPLGNIEFRHDLDARDQSLVISEIDWIDFLVQRSVDAVLDLNFGVAGFDVNVGCARLHRVINDRVDQLDDRRHLAVSRQAVEVENFLARLCFADERKAEA